MGVETRSQLFTGSSTLDVTHARGSMLHALRPSVPGVGSSSLAASEHCREEEDEVNRLIREEMRMLSRQSTRLNVNERGERLKKMAQSRASREVGHFQLPRVLAPCCSM
eukprot:scaffold301379_cov32-Tisochrysis_lutea.AAC.1